MNDNQTKTSSLSAKTIRRIVFSVLAIVLFVAPALVVAFDLRAWNDATAVKGQVVAIRPEGPFPEELDVEYTLPNESPQQVTIRFNFTSARKVGDEVELLIRADWPKQPLTRIQIPDSGWSVSVYWLFGSLLLATFCLSWAFPEFIRVRQGRRSF